MLKQHQLNEVRCNKHKKNQYRSKKYAILVYRIKNIQQLLVYLIYIWNRNNKFFV